MEKYFLPYDLSLILKQKGYNEPCLGTFNSYGHFDLGNTEYPPDRNSDCLFDESWEKAMKASGINHTSDMLCTAPIWEDVIEWFEIKHKIYISFGVDRTMEPKFAYQISEFVEKEQRWVNHVFNSELFFMRKDARYEAIKYALTLI